MKKSWLYLTTKKFVDSDGLSKSGLGKLFEEFYAKFLHDDHVGKRLFEGVGLKVQGRALVTIVGLIVRSLDDWSAFTSQIRRLGGKHQIMGIKQKNFDNFAQILSDCIAAICVGLPDHASNEIQSVWKKVVSCLGTFLVEAYPVSSVPCLFVPNRRILSSGSWKKTAVTLGLDTVYIYRDEEMQRLRTSIPILSIHEYEVVNNQDTPLPFGVKIFYGVSISEAIFTFHTQTASEEFYQELKWRCLIVHRKSTCDDIGSSELDSTSHKSTEERRSNKSRFGLARK
eukprot:TRINITY_DN7988_c0_g3_i1.p1 TRINITY_DN7988_c0_g3~~TRINITY_DN7988_c0_g3_i1.p1  ORF type:complete len:284 (+),score=61.11 TRINITY_DN7988_c0_g3_i1:115-966(+)